MKNFSPLFCQLPFLLMISSTASAIDAEVARCRSVAGDSPRLACYDSMSISGTLIQVDSKTVGLNSTPVVRVDNSPTAAFGMEYQKAQIQVESILSSINGLFQGWDSKSSIQLANGQVWQISDRSSGIYELMNPKVVVKRGAFGSFHMEIEGVGRLPTVRRLR